MSIMCVVVHVLCVYCMPQNGYVAFCDFFGTRSGFFLWRQVGNPSV